MTFAGFLLAFVFLLFLILAAWIGALFANERYGRTRDAWLYPSRRKYLIVSFYRGETQKMGAIKFAESEIEAEACAKALLHNTLNWQVLVYKWDNKNKRVDCLVSERNTFKDEAKEREGRKIV